MHLSVHDTSTSNNHVLTYYLELKWTLYTCVTYPRTKPDPAYVDLNVKRNRSDNLSAKIDAEET